MARKNKMIASDAVETAPMPKTDDAATASMVEDAPTSLSPFHGLGDVVEQLIPLSSIVTGESMRTAAAERTKDQEEQWRNDINELMATMREVGQLQAICVRPILRAGPSRTLNLPDGTPVSTRPFYEDHEIVFGERRTEAARNLGWETIRAVVRTLTDAEAHAARVIENLPRVDPSPIEKAVAIKVMVDLHGGDLHRVARMLGIGHTAVRSQLRMADFTGDVAKHFKAGRLPQKHAEIISLLADPRMRDRLADDVVNYWDGPIMPLEELRQAVNEDLLSLKIVPWKKDVSLTVLKSVHGFGKVLPPCDTCQYNSANDKDLFSGLDLQGNRAPGDADALCSHAECFDAKKAHARKLLDDVAPKVVKALEKEAKDAGKDLAVKVGEAAVERAIETVTHGGDAKGAKQADAVSVLDPGAVAQAVKQERKDALPKKQAKAAAEAKKDPVKDAEMKARAAWEDATKVWKESLDAACNGYAAKKDNRARVLLFKAIIASDTYGDLYNFDKPEQAAKLNDREKKALKTCMTWLAAMKAKKPSLELVLDLLEDHRETGGLKINRWDLQELPPPMLEVVTGIIGFAKPEPKLDVYLKQFAPAAAEAKEAKAEKIKKTKAALNKAAARKTGRVTRTKTGTKAAKKAGKK
jgi:ParB/RepB/Spo0J family partition protein